MSTMNNFSSTQNIKKTILVTGANGFIGSSLINSFVNKGNFDVIGSIRRDYLSSRKNQFARYFYDLDVDCDKGWDKAMDGVECLIHCAAK